MTDESIQMTDEIREKLAEYAHNAWAGWMEYMFSQGTCKDLSKSFGITYEHTLLITKRKSWITL